MTRLCHNLRRCQGSPPSVFSLAVSHLECPSHLSFSMKTLPIVYSLAQSPSSLQNCLANHFQIRTLLHSYCSLRIKAGLGPEEEKDIRDVRDAHARCSLTHWRVPECEALCTQRGMKPGEALLFSDWLLSLSSVSRRFLHFFHGLVAHLFLEWKNNPLSECTIVYLSIYLRRDILVVSKFWQL